ncbi:hypothetical protein KY314_01415 [Candidatus Woesearchaeota archaeon]|nr:hypothetical protein [Candidatus Woesearchaeota archaeon]
MAETKKSKLVLKKKKWHFITAPKILREAEVGQTYISDPASAINRKLKASMMQITGEPKTQNTKIELKITGQHEGKLTTEIIGYELTKTAMKRMIRRGRTKIHDSIILETEDKKKVRIKPVLVTRNKVLSGTKKELRRKMLEYVKETLSKKKYNELMNDLINKKFQRTGKDVLRKICPIHIFDVSKIRLIENK